MSQILADLKNAATWTVLQQAGNANANGSVLDLATYRGPVTFVCAVSQITSGLGAAHLNAAYVQHSTDNSTFTNVTNGAFTAVVNAANASNCGIQTLTFTGRALNRYVRVPIEVSGTNTNVPVNISVIAQKQYT